MASGINIIEPPLSTLLYLKGCSTKSDPDTNSSRSLLPFSFFGRNADDQNPQAFLSTEPLSPLRHATELPEKNTTRDSQVNHSLVKPATPNILHLLSTPLQITKWLGKPVTVTNKPSENTLL
jgi:hypothetical protein